MSPEVPDALLRQPLAALVRIGHELAVRARRLQADYLCAQIPTRNGLLVFTLERRAVWVSGDGFDVELSALPDWERWRPPGY